MGPRAVNTPSASDRSSAGEAPRHLYDVDVVRLTTVLGVLGVHGTSLLLPSSELTGATLGLLHVTREVFLFLSAFVLAYSVRLPIRAVRFWGRRFPLVLAPYVLWSALYVLADGGLDSPGSVLARYSRDLLSGAARFHLYFLLLTFQLYIVFPWVRSWVLRRRHHGRLLAAAVVWQVAFTSAIHFRLQFPAPLSTWLAHPGTWLPSYVLYVVAGILAAAHFDQVRAWVGARARLLGIAALVVAVLGVTSYELEVHLGHVSPLHAAEVFGPAVVIEAMAAICAQFALGLWVARRFGPRPLGLLRASSDVSFGVYLVHPLLYQGFVAFLGAFGEDGGLGFLPEGAGLALLLVVIVPTTYLVAATGIWVLRRTPFSLAVTGRRAMTARRAGPPPPPADERPGICLTPAGVTAPAGLGGQRRSVLPLQAPVT